MKVPIVDLGYKTNDILKALDRSESVTVLYHGKVKGIIKPARGKTELKVKEHPFFGVRGDSGTTVLEELESLRKPHHGL
ncbi:MAG: type II toxin-antitoxin system Phd/YefM family antitoxin [Gammaproteobacteria bacterium]|nr:type II toxin-antitoxin system Phd/YefM family antitoxin [Gammaproteobacteria bacterium]MCF6260377.1 type II toxin-antitoxin system Phd/YefM family antitoxin [Gammaproteobacteria bacterium]